MFVLCNDACLCLRLSLSFLCSHIAHPVPLDSSSHCSAHLEKRHVGIAGPPSQSFCSVTELLNLQCPDVDLPGKAQLKAEKALAVIKPCEFLALFLRGPVGFAPLGQTHTMHTGLVVLLSQKIPPAQPKNTEGSTQEKCESNMQARELSFIKRKRKGEFF